MQGPPVGKSTLRLVTQRTPFITNCRSVGVQWHHAGITPIYWCDKKRRLFAFLFHHCLQSASSTSTSFLIPILPSSPSPPGICYPATSKPIQGQASRLTHGNERVWALLFPVCGSSLLFIPAVSSPLTLLSPLGAHPAASKPIQGQSSRLSHEYKGVWALLFPTCGSSLSVLPPMPLPPTMLSPLSNYQPAALETISGLCHEPNAWKWEGYWSLIFPVAAQLTLPYLFLITVSAQCDGHVLSPCY